MDYTAIKNAALIALIVVAVIGVLLAIVVKKIIGKILSLAIAVILVVLFWQQRQHITSAFNDAQGKVHAQYCATHPKFLGLKVNLPGCS